jgi:HK97 family phage portal protein
MFNWLTTRFSGRDHLQTQAPEALTVPTWPAGPAALDGDRAYASAPWVYVAVSRIAEAGALVPLEVVRSTRDGREALPDHPLLHLLAQPNPLTSRFELIEATLAALELHGNAYWFLLGGGDGLPAEIWPLHPGRMTVVPGGAGGVRGYVYAHEGQQLALEPVEVVHFRRYNPADPFYGQSTLAAAREAVAADSAMAAWNRRTFSEGHAVPAGIVNIAPAITDGDYERIRRDWQAAYGGGQRRTAFLRGGDISWQSIGLSHSELDFLKGRQAGRDEILAIFGIPVGLIAENATEANARVAERSFIERTLWPKLVRLAAKMTVDLLPFYDGAADCAVAFSDIRPTDTDARLAELRAAYPVLSINEIRARYYGLGPVAWGEGSASAAHGHAGV